jgi:hypothetical protein
LKGLNYRIQNYNIIATPDLKPDSAMDYKLKHHAHTEFQLVNNRLFRRSDSRFSNLRPTAPETEHFDTIVSQHLQLLHAGQISIWAAIQHKRLWRHWARSGIYLKEL